MAMFNPFGAREPLLPEAGAGGPPLTAVIAVIAFLATLSLAGYLLVSNASENWTRELRAALTIQIPGDSAEAIQDRTNAAVIILRTTPGVVDFQVMSPEESAKLLEPWLGEGTIDAYFSVPALIEVRADPSLQENIENLKGRMRKAAPGSIVNDHSTWKSRLVASVRSAQILAFSVFFLVMVATCAIAVFAARAGLAANHEVVSILHLVGASDEFIAGQVQRRFLILGLRGAIGGVILAIFVLGAMSFATRTGAVEQNLIPGFTLTWGFIMTLFIVPVVTCLVTALTARLTVMRTLREAY